MRADVIRLEHELNLSESSRNQAIRDAIRAYEINKIVPKLVVQNDSHVAAKTALKGSYAAQYKAVASLKESVAEMTSLKETNAALTKNILVLPSLEARAQAAEVRREAALARAAHAVETTKRIGAEAAATQAALNATSRNLFGATDALSMSEQRVAELELELEKVEARLDRVDQQLSVETAKTAPKRGRPAAGHVNEI